MVVFSSFSVATIRLYHDINTFNSTFYSKNTHKKYEFFIKSTLFKKTYKAGVLSSGMLNWRTLFKSQLKVKNRVQITLTLILLVILTTNLFSGNQFS